MTYKMNKKKECPYCRSDGGYLKLKDGMVPLFNIHREFDDYVNGNFNMDNIKYIEGRCKQILKTGKNALNVNVNQNLEKIIVVDI